jgi:Grx4 family monothiol glutaredoxin
MATNIQTITDISGIPDGCKVVVFFYADWHEACQSGGPLDQILGALSSSTSPPSSSASTDSISTNAIVFGRCNVDENPILTEKYSITAVPTFCLINGMMSSNSSKNDVTRIVGGEDIAAITSAVQRLQQSTVVSSNQGTSATVAPQPEIDDTTRLNQRLHHLIRSSEVMIFMKGTPEQPRCGFSRQVIEIFTNEQIPIATFDILTDEDVRQGLKVYSNWPTYPQVYVHGELVGGLDILKEMLEDNSTTLAEQLGVARSVAVAPIAVSPNDMNASTKSVHENDLDGRLKQLVNRSHVMLFMKGVPSMPKCGFSRQICETLEELKISYDAYDILTDETVRQGLKVYSDWPTYPQLYVAGELIGGLDIVKEMKEDGTLQEALSHSP